ncbi:MAG: 1-acyl-sn-glycerol-3-phosphate acyltransferase [Cyclobacteriaceae bacterium]|jgi:1-acyl-sn-glycerol-3-phosphate acyltransferase
MKQLSKWFFLFWFWVFGWKMKGKKPDLKKFVLIIAPHTSNWDFFIGLAARSLSDLESRFLIKDSVTKIPIVGSIVYALGGRGINRSKSTNVVDQVVELFTKEEEFVMTITPEGTRSYNSNWKTGFYRIAVKANIPIQLVAFDFEHRLVEYAELLYPSGDMEADIERMKAYYRTIKGRNPALGVK